MDNVIELLSATIERDKYGVERQIYTAREVFCQVHSVSRAEFFDGGRSGLNPEYQLTMFAGDYEGEGLVRYEGNTYAVYRTYKPDNSDYIELYIERKGGSNGKNGTA